MTEAPEVCRFLFERRIDADGIREFDFPEAIKVELSDE
jgi:hypothetical protein